VDYRTEAFKTKFTDAGRHLGVTPKDVVSLKLRENVSSNAEYRDFFRALEHEAGFQCSPADGNLQGKGYLLSDGSSRVIIVEHETGLEILYVAGSIASLIGILPLVIQGWRAFRSHYAGRRDFDDRGVEIRRIDEKGHLSEEHVHERTLFEIPPFTANTFLAKSAAKTIESELQQVREQIKLLTRRVDALEGQSLAKAKRRKSRTKGSQKTICRPRSDAD
jgi:hypothetical protein